MKEFMEIMQLMNNGLYNGSTLKDSYPKIVSLCIALNPEKLDFVTDWMLTEECFDHGWYRTGDIGYMDRKGHLYICGRKKNLIVFNSGKKVVPEELEGYIQKIPFVKEVMVYGAVVGEAGDDVMLSAMVCVDEEYMDARDNYQVLDLLQDEINKLNMTLPDYKRILSVKLSETEFKKTAIKKIKRKEAE